MNTQQLDAAIRAQIDQFLVSISALVRQAAVEAVREALEDGAVPATRDPGRPRKAAGTTPKAPGRRAAAAKPGRRVRRSSADVEKVAAEVLAYVRSHPGERLEEIGRGLGTDTAGLKRPIQGLLAAGELRTEGQKRGTRYFPGVPGAATSEKSSKRADRKAAKQVVVKPAGKRAKRAAKKGGRKSGGRTSSAADPVTAA